VDTGVNRVEIASRQPRTDCPTTETQTEKLPSRHHTMLSIGELGNQLVPRSSRHFGPCDGLYWHFDWHALDAGESACANGAHKVTFVQTKRQVRAHGGHAQTRLQPAGTASGFDPLK
jgi:hypothetical protein